MKQIKQRFWALTLSVAMLFSVWVPTTASAAAPVEDLDGMHVQVMATSDVHGAILATDYSTHGTTSGGLTRVATKVKELREANPNSLLIDVGDTIQGTPLTYYHAFEVPEEVDPAIKALRLMGYDAWVLGNHEFNYGLDILTRQMDQAKAPSSGDESRVPVLAANFVQEGTEWEPWEGNEAYIVKEFEDAETGTTVKVGVLGVDTPNIPQWEKAENYEGIDFRNFVPTYEHYIDIMKEEEGCDVIVVAAHAGVESEHSEDGAHPENSENQVRALIENTTGIDLVFSGHLHISNANATVTNKEGKEIPVVSPGTKANGLAYVDLVVNPDAAEGEKVTVASKEIISMRGVEEDAELKAALQPYEDRTWEYLEQPLGTATGDFSSKDLALAPSAFMDLVNKVQIEATGAQLSICAPLTSGGGENLIPKGDISLGLMYRLYKYENWLYSVKMSVREIKDWMEFAATKYRVNPETGAVSGGGIYLDVLYGMDYEIHLYAPEGERIQNMTYQGRPVSDDEIFTVAMNNYRFTGGGDYIAHVPTMQPDDKSRVTFSTQEQIGEDEGQVRNLLAEYIREQGTISPEITSTWRIYGRESDVPDAAHALYATFDPKKVQLSLADGDVGFANLTGNYQASVMAGESVELTFAPTVSGRKLASATLNGEPLVLDSSEEYTHSFDMPNGTVLLDFQFTVVNKEILRTVIQIAEGLQDSEEYAGAVPTVQKRFDKALEKAKQIDDTQDVMQEEIDTAWQKLMDAIQYLSFQAGDKTALEELLAVADLLQKDDFTTSSWNAFEKALEAAQIVYDNPDAMEDEIQEARQALSSAIDTLQYKADLHQLQLLIDKANEIEPKLESEYVDIHQDSFKAFRDALAAACKITEECLQEQVDQAASALNTAIAELRKIPNKDALKALIEEAQQVPANRLNAKDAARLESALDRALNTLADPFADEEAIAAEEENLRTVLKSLSTSQHHQSGSSSKSNSSASLYGAEGTAIVGASAPKAYVVCDTTLPFSLKHGSAYCFKMTVINGNGLVPNFTVGDGSILKTQFVAQIGNDFYFRVYAIGTSGQSAGVYTQLPGPAPQRHCSVTID